MRTGLAKQFKQVLDAQARRAREAAGRRPAAGEMIDEEPADDGDRRAHERTPSPRRRDRDQGLQGSP